jgi:two-component system phosphate regulon sensor histidine kinase PhoR
MTSPPAQLVFGVEFGLFLVSAAGLALVLLRAELLTGVRASAAAIGTGFAAVAGAAFVRGASLLPQSFDPRALTLGLGEAGIALVLSGTGLGGPGQWRAGRLALRLVWVGGLLEAGGLALGFAAPSAVAPLALVAAGTAAVGLALLMASRLSVAARVAATTAGTLLALVLVLSVALSEVVSAAVRNDAAHRLDERALSQASAISETFTRELRARAVLLGQLVEGYLQNQCHASVDVCVRQALPPIAGRYFSDVEAAWISPGGQVVAVSPNFAARLGLSTAAVLAHSPPVQAAAFEQLTTPTPLLVEGRPLAVAAYPDVVRTVVPGGQALARTVGVVLVVSPLDASYLAAAAADDPSLALALVSPGGVLAASGPQPPFPLVRPLVDAVLHGPVEARSLIAAGRFVSVRAVLGSNAAPVMALVASTSTGLLEQTNRTLFRTLFLIALGGTLLALLLASVVGDRVGAGLRRLTTAAEAIQRGESGVRAELDATDEVGTLGSAFNSMAVSIEEKTDALRQAADDEARLRNRLEAVVAGMGEALVAIDAEGRVTDFNQAAEELIGTSAAAARGRSVDEVVRLVSDDGADLSERLRQPPVQRWAVQGWVHQLSGPPVPVAVSAGAVRGPGLEIAGGVFVLRDLRREREVERMKTEFLSRIGHELRTPLTGIMGFTDLLTRKQVPAERARAWHEEILQQSKRLLRTVEMLEFFASSGAGRVTIRPEWLDLRSMLDDLVRRWTPRLPERHVLVRRVARDLPPVVADRRWLTLAVDELVDNAVKFSPNGGRITVRAALADGGRFVEIAVADQGKGMSEEEAARAFADFVQGDGSDTRQFGGLGLGLSLVQRVAENHGGSVLCQSAPGRGSRVAILLPVLSSS